ncbi:MAG TPA: hypothetical protein VIK18_14385 [Pirellulales bacterium]
MWHELIAGYAADRAQHEQAVNVGRHERSQHDLIAAVAHEISQQPSPNWFEANDRATIVTEKTTPATVIIDSATVERTDRAPSGPRV